MVYLAVSLYVGMRIGKLEILEIHNKTCKCKCDCGVIKEFSRNDLSKNKIKSCGSPIHRLKNDLTGKQFGEWTVQYYAGRMKWHCKCSCGNESDVGGQYLLDGRSKSCGHKNMEKENLLGMSFGNWDVIGYANRGKWLCRCRCNNHTERVITAFNLKNGLSLSCGCNKKENMNKTNIARYGDVFPHKSREDWQIKALNSKEDLAKYIFKSGITDPLEIGKNLGISISMIYRYIHKYELERYVDIYSKQSIKEKELRDICRKYYDGEILYNNRTIIKPQELDIYIPDLKIAIEFNGNYWHCDALVDKYYHLNKTRECSKKGIRLIHIFEYEFDHNREGIEQYIKNLLGKYDVIQARNTRVETIDKNEAKEFLSIYHIQGYATASINLGCYFNDSLIGVMTFDKPRFNSNFEYELIRFCWKDNIRVIGGANKLFSKFIKEYNPSSIITYSDISKFFGYTYDKLGFRRTEVTDPSYVWVNGANLGVLSRYDTQKDKLVSLGLDVYGQTEDEIMHNIGYLKIYNCGNFKFIWTKSNN